MTLNKLTPTLEKRLPEIRNKWITVGLRTGPGSLKDAWAGIQKAYVTAGREEPKFWVWLESPFRAVYGCAVLGQVFVELQRPKSAPQVSDQVSAQVSEFLGSWWYWMPGQFEGWWLSYFEALRDHCSFEKLEGLIQVAESCAFAWTFPDVVVFSAPPIELHLNAARQLHCETGPAIKFADGWGVWALNGVRLTQEIVETPAGQLDPKLVTTTQNAEWRRELVRKIGIERVCDALNAKCVDKDGDYELLILTLGDRRKRPFLKMRNPSIRVFHIEGVSPECRTVQQALNFRNGLTPEMIDEENGADWIQQGDVILRPRGPKTFKSRPIVLT
ncbi:MAG: DUF6745 domain-containing protein [bacterium]